jgi:hypothetical protein
VQPEQLLPQGPDESEPQPAFIGRMFRRANQPCR